MVQGNRKAYALVPRGERHEDDLYRAGRYTSSFQNALSSMTFGSCRRKRMMRIGSPTGSGVIEAGEKMAPMISTLPCAGLLRTGLTRNVNGVGYPFRSDLGSEDFTSKP